jgi:hypothetical protein
VKRTLLISFAFSAAFLSTTAAQGQVDPKALVSESIRNYQRDWQAIRTNWASTESDITEADGTKQANVSEVIPVAGTPYDRLILKNGHPLTPAEQRREDRKFERALRQREQEAPSEREARIRKYDQERALVTDIPNAYSFKLLGEELVDGRPAWILAMTPRPDFTPSTPHGSLLGHVEGKLWIDEGDVRWVKAEAHVIDTIGIGWVLARIEPGAQFTLEQTRVENELWVPRRITIAGAARVMIFHSKSISEELTWSGYRKDGGVSADKRDSVNSGARSLSKSFR